MSKLKRLAREIETKGIMSVNTNGKLTASERVKLVKMRTNFNSITVKAESFKKRSF